MLLERIIAKNNNSIIENLYNHSINIANFSHKLASDLCDNETICWLSYVTALLHDIGKSSNEFQQHITEQNDDVYYPLHNVLGACLVSAFIKTINPSQYEYIDKIIAKTILYHHPFTNVNLSNQFQKINEIIEDPLFIDVIKEFIEVNNNRFPTFKLELNTCDDIDAENIIERLAYYDTDMDFAKSKQDVFHIVSNIVRFADSNFETQSNIDRIINKSISIGLEDIHKPLNYDNRFDVQMDYVKTLCEHRDCIFESQTGFGKTMLGLLYSLLVNNKKTYWICPRNSIAHGIYSTVTKELKALGLDTKISVGLLLTNSFIKGNASSDIIITNIDNFLRPIVYNDSLSRTYDLIYSNCIFDEFHEYIMDAPLMALFEIMVRARHKINTNTLYLSATPILQFFKGVDKVFHIEHVDETIANRRYKIQFYEQVSDVYNDKNMLGSLISTTSTKYAQDLVVNGCANKTFHSRFLNSDKERLFNELVEEFGKSTAPKDKRNVVSATNIVTTGIDISFNSVTIVSPVPDRLIQTIGRCNRWNEYNNSAITICPIPKYKECQSEVYSIKQQLYEEITNSFYEFLKAHLKDSTEVTFRILYELRKKFYSENNQLFLAFFKKHKSNSFKSLSKINYQFVSPITPTDVDVRFIGSNKLRETNGSNFFCVLKDTNNEYIDELFDGNDLIFNFERDVITAKDGKYLINKFETEYSKLYQNNTQYYKNKKELIAIRNKNKLIPDLLNKARYSNTPIHIPFIWCYDKNLGVIKTTN